MKADHSLHHDNLSFSLQEAAGPEVSAPTRFARALKQARFAKGWTQVKLAAQLSISKRSIVSWETAERVPSIGIVVLLLDALFAEEELSLHHELLCAYIADDLERQEQRQNGPLRERIQRVIGRVLHLPIRDKIASKGALAAEEKAGYTFAETHEPERQVGELEPLFALLTQLHQHPELITVANDFVRELAPGG